MSSYHRGCTQIPGKVEKQQPVQEAATSGHIQNMEHFRIHSRQVQEVEEEMEQAQFTDFNYFLGSLGAVASPGK